MKRSPYQPPTFQYLPSSLLHLASPIIRDGWTVIWNSKLNNFASKTTVKVAKLYIYLTHRLNKSGKCFDLALI